MNGTVEAGSLVKLCYRGKLQDAEGFEPDKSCQQVELTVGNGEIMEGFEKAIIGMEQNEKKTFTLSPDRAYGEYDPAMVRTFKRSELPFDFGAKRGDLVALQTNWGDQILATVMEEDAEQVTLDLNHPLAGKSLTFEVEIEQVNM